MAADFIDINQIRSDIKAEVIAASLIESQKCHLDELVIAPTGQGHRPIRRDVARIHDGKGLLSNAGKTGEYTGLKFIDVSRSGIYDYLPQGFFHQPKKGSSGKSIDNSIEEMRISREQEGAARLFFLPLEKELNRKRVEMEQEERKSLLGFTEHYKTDLFLRIWPQLKGIDQKYLVIIFQILPLSYEIAKSKDLIAFCLSTLSGKQVTITTTDQPKSVTFTTENYNQLGKRWLGIDTILGSSIEDYDPQIEISITDIDKDELHRFIHEGDMNRIITWMLDFFMPCFSNVKLNLALLSEHTGLVLSDDVAESYLNHNSCI